MKEGLELLNFKELSPKELEMVLEWRNTKEIQKWMLTREDISLQTHLNFVNSLANAKDKEFFLVKDENSPIGVINFTDITPKSCSFGLYKNPQINGVGDKLMRTICDYAFNRLKIDKLKAEVFTNNEKAIQLYKKYNFIEKQRVKYKERELILMELQR